MIKILDRTSLFLCLIVAIKLIFMILLISSHLIGLSPDEAQYWTWSQQLAWGYYSKPPGIAWLIALSCYLFGNSELSVRAVSLLIGALLPFSVYRLAKACNLKSQTALWAGALMALSPLGILASLLTITDGGQVLCWTLACSLLATALVKKKPPSYLLLGLLIGGGALFKWPIYYLWLMIIPLYGIYPFFRQRAPLFRGLALSLVGLVPSLIWNSQHHWVTFRHVAATITNNYPEKLSATGYAGGNFWAFLGEQVALLSPILFVLLLCALIKLFNEWRSASSSANLALYFCGSSFTAIILLFSFLSLFKKIQGNWCDFAYPPAIVLVSWYVNEKLVKKGRLLLLIGISLSLLICGMLFAIPLWQARQKNAKLEIPYKLNPFRHNIGWQALQPILAQLGYDPQKHILFSDRYQMSSILSFYGTEQKRAYFLNLQGMRFNQFSFWQGMAKGSSGYFVIAENQVDFPLALQEKYRRQLKNYFHEVGPGTVEPLFWNNGKPVKLAFILFCDRYNGTVPSATSLY